MPTAWPAVKVISIVVQTDAAAMGDDNGLVVEGIIDIGQSRMSARQHQVGPIRKRYREKTLKAIHAPAGPPLKRRLGVNQE